MNTNLPTTPFGRRPLSLAMVASQSIAKECPAGIAVNKWQVFRAICEARSVIGVSERALAVLDALLSFHPETILTAAEGLIVFPSNRQLSLRAHGMAASTLRRHLAVLVEAGLIVRRDSPNGKRYRRGSEDADDAQAFGFDLTPLVARASEYEAYARTIREERMIVSRLRESITIARRDIVKMCATGTEEGVAGDWVAIKAAYASLIDRLPRQAPSQALVRLAEEFEQLRAAALKLLESHVKSEEKTGNESQIEHHKQNSKPNLPLESEPAFRRSEGKSPKPDDTSRSAPQRSFPLPVILQACPDIVDYARGGISSWRDFVTAAEVARGALGISPSAYEEAQEVLGHDDAAIVVAAVLQKGESINNAGAYLRGLTCKARAGQFSPGPMVMALLKQQVRARMIA